MVIYSVFPLVWESVGWYWEGFPGDQFSNSFWIFGSPWADKATNGKESVKVGLEYCPLLRIG